MTRCSEPWSWIFKPFTPVNGCCAWSVPGGRRRSESKLKWQEEIPLDLPDFQGDPLRLGQAIANLIANAQKYTPAGGEVSFSAGANDQEIWVMVSDTGPGISLDEQEKIFLPFYRGAQAGRIPQGMGPGLSIAQDPRQGAWGKD